MKKLKVLIIFLFGENVKSERTFWNQEIKNNVHPQRNNLRNTRSHRN